MPVIKERLKANNFRLPIEKIRGGPKSDTYFNRSKEVLELDMHHQRVTMQVFQKVPDAVVCGVDYALAILETGTGYYKNTSRAQRLFESYLRLERELHDMWRHLRNVSWEIFSQKQLEIFLISQSLDTLWEPCFGDLEIEALYDGETVGARQPVMLIRGDISTFVHLETPYLGALTDGTMVATNTRDVVRAANGKPVLMFGARHQAAESQAGSGYAAYVGGVTGVSTDEQGEYWGAKGMGTMPHALIASYGGDTVLATKKFDQYIDRNVKLVSLVDFDNDSVGTSLKVARALGNKLHAVRLDTSENMIDLCFEEDRVGDYYHCEMYRGKGEIEQASLATLTAENVRGVNAYLVSKVRKALDEAGFWNVGIFVSGGFNAEKIKQFEDARIPVNGYGVGSALFGALFDRRGGKFEYTADVVEPVAKAGRGLWNGPELKRVVPEEIL